MMVLFCQVTVEGEITNFEEIDDKLSDGSALLDLHPVGIGLGGTKTELVQVSEPSSGN